MNIKARCRKCRTKIEYGKSYCMECSQKVQTERNAHKNKKINSGSKISSRKWIKVREQIIIRDNGVCVLCLLKYNRIFSKGLEVHHIVKRVDNPSLMYSFDNLVTVCRECHEELEKLSPEKQRKLLNKEESEGLDFSL
jgi:5-methylcytosine-specific restriction endonuclease McrA